MRAQRFSGVELFVSLLLLIVAEPFLDVLPHSELIRSALLTLVLLAATMVVGEKRNTRIFAALLAAPAFVARWANYFRPDLVPSAFFLTPALVFVSIVVLNLFRFILRTQRVDVHVLSVATSIYLLLGILWTFAYMLVVELSPAAFSIGGGNGSEGMDPFNALYFSFVTLCTLGYGDITPVSRLARVLSILEATAGMFYMGIFIARLVALYSSEAATKERH
jgi:hypothetical protein